MMLLPALSIRQPWPWSILNLNKDIENRDWYTRFRGRFLIHAAKGMTRDEYEDGLATAQHVAALRPDLKGIVFPGFSEFQRGGIVGSVEIVDCVKKSESPWFFGRYGFVLKDVRPLPFLACKGKLGFFKVDCPYEAEA